ncbi:MAG: glutamine--tRNA ligase, partial [Phycisphaerae bacterium]|nr:glutamine--tRNA ligase [Phycisphaerae bacterium]
LDAEVRLYEHLFTKENPEDAPEGQDFTVNINPDSLKILTGCKVEPSLKNTKPLDRWQFERLGYFCTDSDTSEGRLVFNRTVILKDTWSKIQQKSQTDANP